MSETATIDEPAGDRPALQQDRPDASTHAAPIGLAGLDRPGIAAAMRLAAAGHQVLACDPDPERRAAYVQAAGPDAAVTGSVAELGRRCTVVLLMLQLGEDAATLHDTLVDALAPGALVIDMGPGLPGTIRGLAAELAARGLRLVDAVLLPSIPPLIAVGGSEADTAHALPILSALGECLLTGPVGTAQALSAVAAELDGVLDRARVLSLI